MNSLDMSLERAAAILQAKARVEGAEVSVKTELQERQVEVLGALAAVYDALPVGEVRAAKSISSSLLGRQIVGPEEGAIKVLGIKVEFDHEWSDKPVKTRISFWGIDRGGQTWSGCAKTRMMYAEAGKNVLTYKQPAYYPFDDQSLGISGNLASINFFIGRMGPSRVVRGSEGYYPEIDWEFKTPRLIALLSTLENWWTTQAKKREGDVKSVRSWKGAIDKALESSSSLKALSG